MMTRIEPSKVRNFRLGARHRLLSFFTFLSFNDKLRTVMTDYFLTANELMETLKVKSTTTFWRMRKRGDVPEPAIKNPLRWKKSQVESYYQGRLKDTK
jgi:predicted DNA-binding transcriptional regulator AlpA